MKYRLLDNILYVETLRAPLIWFNLEDGIKSPSEGVKLAL